jgi:hypothetical protein
MNSRAVRALALLTLVAAGGCGSAPTPAPPRGDDPAAEERRFGHYRDLLGEEVRARAKLKAARPQLVAHEKVISDLELRRAQLGPPPPAMKERLQQEFQERLVQLETARRREVARICEIPGGRDFFDTVKELKPPQRP